LIGAPTSHCLLEVIEAYNKENAALVTKLHEATTGYETHDRIIHELRTQLRSQAETSEGKLRLERRKLEDAHERETRQAETLQAMDREREETREKLSLSIQATVIKNAKLSTAP
jgi:chromosome segregation ATPase